MYFVCFFFQAEDGIRDTSVTGVQTCALPISVRRDEGGGTRSGRREGEGDRLDPRPRPSAGRKPIKVSRTGGAGGDPSVVRSEERRVGKSVDLGGRSTLKKKDDTTYVKTTQGK